MTSPDLLYLSCADVESVALEMPVIINLGLALDDMAVAPEIFRRAKERGIGTWLRL